MFAKKILLLSAGLVSFNLNANAVVNCATDCTRDTACRFTYKIKECAKECPNFQADICTKSTANAVPQPAADAVPAGVPNTGKSDRIEQGTPKPPQSLPRPQTQRVDGAPLENAAPIVKRPLPSPPRPNTTPPMPDANLMLSKAQIEMLTEVNRVASECDRMVSEVAQNGALDPQAYKKYVENQDNFGEAKEIFPKSLKSVFASNPKYCSSVIDPKKMDHESFVNSLKNQITTTKTMEADILRKILGWNDMSNIEKYKLSVSGDLRALSSFCSGPLKILNEAITYKSNTPSKKTSPLKGIKNLITGKKGEK